jgi:hypothetical protein
MTDDIINHPAHYTHGKMECIDAIEGLELGYHEGAILKYIVRYKHKNGIEDLKKAKWYLERLIQNETKEVP